MSLDVYVFLHILAMLLVIMTYVNTYMSLNRGVSISQYAYQKTDKDEVTFTVATI